MRVHQEIRYYQVIASIWRAAILFFRYSVGVRP